ncbi:hypothetical protein [Thiosocius teredinicola]|uniref:hypothetical protein n=1 Tax=Thiosocius teredinicola TaxID=1973002 RepID=UPI000990E11A
MTPVGWYILVGLVLISMGLLASRIRRMPMTTAVFYLFVGVLIGPSERQRCSTRSEDSRWVAGAADHPPGWNKKKPAPPSQLDRAGKDPIATGRFRETQT